MQRLKTLYLKTRVMQLAPELPFIMADMTQQPIEEYKKVDSFKNPFGFEQALFLAQCINKWNIDYNHFTPVEKHYYDKSVDQFNRFYELHQFITQLKELATNVYYLYVNLSTEEAASNLSSFSYETGDEVAQQLDETIAEFNRMDKELESYSEWQSKLREDIGKYINIIYSLHIENPKLEKILGSFDRHLYFK